MQAVIHADEPQDVLHVSDNVAKQLIQDYPYSQYDDHGKLIISVNPLGECINNWV